jgi:hypothetical protein
MPQSYRTIGAIVLAISARYDAAAASGGVAQRGAVGQSPNQRKPASQRHEVAR